ncbi:hypothetical protein [Halococcus agarilyticus]|uniref:hypothetical protein n=1 Tax=Halococcus agarilyticus TaxID=1232219 RepID=UPI0012ABAEBC|nr:hypothetical protein [Halococcus agarilyticus]
MTVEDMDRAAGKCDECGAITALAISDTGTYAVGNAECPNCGSEEYSLLEYVESDD